MQNPQKIAYAKVILDDALDNPLDYEIPENLLIQAKVGSRVLVPLRNSLRKGTIWQIKDHKEIYEVKKIQEILSESPLISTELLHLAEWISKYYCSPIRKVLKLLLPSSIRKNMQEEKKLFIKPFLSQPKLKDLCESLRKTQASQAQVLDVLLRFPQGIFLSDLLEKAKVSKSPVLSLAKKKALLLEKISVDRSYLLDEEYFVTKPKSLHVQQLQALDRISESLSKNIFSAHLLYGITGSGKTEVYLQAIDKALKQKKGVIFLIPEIILASQTIERLKSRFQEKIAILHHRLSQGEKRDHWHHIQSGRAPIVIGARSAIFSPVPNLGLIIVDEEHEASYKQNEESPCYHARDVALMRGKFSHATVVLGSATPSIESFYNAKRNKYILSCLSSRPGDATLPSITILDMKKEYMRAKGFTLFSEQLLDSIKKRIDLGEQTLLFLNRRGYHTSSLCLHCTKTISCQHCDIALTYHRGEEVLSCHLCDFSIPSPRECPSCKQSNVLKFKGAGTELVEKSLHALFPEIRTLRMDKDTTKLKGSHDRLYKEFKTGKADVLIGTQMIAKGLHFPSVTLVCVLNADISLQIPDFRSSETVFQLLTQVAGRAGRRTLPGEVLIQTLLPDNSTILLAKKQSYDEFFQEELEVRKAFFYPPFSRLIKLIFIAEDQAKTQHFAENVRESFIPLLPPSCEILPVIPCGHAKIKDKFRFQFLIKAEKTPILSSYLPQIQKLAAKEKIQFFVDVDPLSTFF